MDPQIWGSHAWIFLHCIAYTYPDNPTYQDKISYLTFFSELGKVLPCYTCRENYKIHLLENPLTLNTLSSKVKFNMWLNTLHNQVNKTLGKKQISYEDGIKKIKNLGNNKNKYIYTILILLLIILVIIYYFYYHTKN